MQINEYLFICTFFQKIIKNVLTIKKAFAILIKTQGG